MEMSFSLPSPTDTPYRTPSSSRSVRSREYEDMSPTTTPPPMPSDIKSSRRRSNESDNAALDENVSPLDPRRITPTLHASLVSEILSLRRDLETKTSDIDRLEQSLHTSQSQNEALNKSIAASNKEVRSVKRQMQLLEGGTLAAINDLSKERDEAVGDAIDLRKRLEQSQKKAKSQEDSADRTQALWDKEKESWAAEKRTLETKIHVVEGRLKTVLSEVAHTQFNTTDHGIQRSRSRSSRTGSPVKKAISEAGDRRQSIASTGSEYAGGRTSVLSFAHPTSTNLADELALDDIEEHQGAESVYEEGRVSPDALPEERGRPASSLSIKARKVLGLPFDIEDMEHGDRSQPGVGPTIWEESSIKSAANKAIYVDSAVQYSRPSSPVRNAGVTSHGAGSYSEVQHDLDSSNLERSTGYGGRSRPTMISSACQTIESLPSPPPTPKPDDEILATVPESAYDRNESREISTQTETVRRPITSYRYIHSRTDTHDLGIPTIAIIPPGSRPITPEGTVVLPPQTKNASCQVDSASLSGYTTSSMQTEEIRVDRRNIISPHLMPGALVSSQVNAATAKGKAPAYPRRNQSSASQTISNSAVKRSAPPMPPMPQFNEDGSLVRDYATDKLRPSQSGGFSVGLDDPIDELEDDFEEDIFEDDEPYNKPTAKFTLRSGKMISQDGLLRDIGEITAANAGEALALETLRMSEDLLPPELRQVDSTQRSKNLSRTSTIRRGQGTARLPSNMRKAAMISSGAAVHQSKLSQSTIASSEGGGVPPPVPIPLRYSSARVGKSFSEGGRSSRGSSNTSPTRQGRHRIKPLLRKTRSGPALSPAALAARRQRSKSPPLDARISIVPEMPVFEMPNEPRAAASYSLVNMPEEASAPRPSVATGPSRAGHKKNDSNAGALQQTSVVDAIAQTMVGEWMFKYVRRRKSFGKPDKDWDPNKSADELINNPSSAGVRHKRWVWVAPYERAVMWSSKQPMTGNALMGKTGRKLTIKSVLDVKDENPMPKNSLTGAQFNRSILILTPQRALKFTATSQERHYIWLTALSFLSHSPLSIGDLSALPPPPEEFHPPTPPTSVGGSFRRRTLRDSIRLTKMPSRQVVAPRSSATDGSALATDYTGTRPPTRDYYDPNEDAAMPPIIKRYHTRERSNTAPKVPPSAFRTFSRRENHPPIPISGPSTTYTQSSVTATDRGSSEQGPITPYTPSLGTGFPSFPSTRRGSESSALPRSPRFPIGSGAVTANDVANNQMTNVSSSFFDSNSSHNASMTMRMDAFIDNKQAGKGGFRNLRVGTQSQAQQSIGGASAVSGTIPPPPVGFTRTGPVNTSADRRYDPSHWGLGSTDDRASISPVDSLNMTLTPVEDTFRYSESTERASVEKDFFRGF